MELAIRHHPSTGLWKAALLALLFIMLLGFGLTRGHRLPPPAAGTMCRCPHTNPAQRCFCPPLGNSCACEK